MEQTPLRDPWIAYLEGTKEREPSPLLQAALTHVAEKKAACDLGAGGLRDTKLLLAEGFEKITCVDAHPKVREYVDDLGSSRVEAVITPFQSFDFPADTYDLVNAQLSLPFTPPQDCERVFADLKRSLKPRGIFTGHFFGVRDEWNTPKEKGMTFLTREDAERLLGDMEIITFEEFDKDGATFHGAKPKHWHRFDIIARKK